MEEIKNLNLHKEWNDINKAETGKNIKRLCNEHDISRKQLAAILGLYSIQAVDHYFSGNNLPRAKFLMIMSILFNTSIEDILVLEGDKRGKIRTNRIEIDDDNLTIDNSLFLDSSKRFPITNFEQLSSIWYDIPKEVREDITKRIFDCLLSGKSVKDHYILHQFEVAYKFAKLNIEGEL